MVLVLGGYGVLAVATDLVRLPGLGLPLTVLGRGSIFFREDYLRLLQDYSAALNNLLGFRPHVLQWGVSEIKVPFIDLAYIDSLS